jgi:hypothetical protein
VRRGEIGAGERRTEDTDLVHSPDAFEHLFGEAFVVHLIQGLFALDDAVKVTVHELLKEGGRGEKSELLSGRESRVPP